MTHGVKNEFKGWEQRGPDYWMQNYGPDIEHMSTQIAQYYNFPAHRLGFITWAIVRHLVANSAAKPEDSDHDIMTDYRLRYEVCSI